MRKVYQRVIHNFKVACYQSFSIKSNTWLTIKVFWDEMMRESTVIISTKQEKKGIFTCLESLTWKGFSFWLCYGMRGMQAHHESIHGSRHTWRIWSSKECWRKNYKGFWQRKKVIPCCVLTELKRLMIANTREQLNCIGSDDMSC